MLHFLNIVYSWSTLMGAAGGFILQRLWRYAEAEYGNRHHPRPDGGKYYAGGVNTVWLAGLVGVLTVGYVLMSAEHARVASVEVANRVSDCQVEFQGALTMRAEIAAQDSDLGNQISDLRTQQDEAWALMMSRILNPPPDIAKLDVNDPRRLAWKTDVQYVWTDWSTKIRAKIVDLTNQRKDLADKRAAHPLPDIKC